MSDSSKFQIHYYKNNMIDHIYNEQNYQFSPEDLEYNYNPFDISNIQMYNPLYNLFFSLNENNYNKIALNHKYHIINKDTIKNMNTNEIITRPIFIKNSPLIDPMKFLIGKYENNTSILNLPALQSDGHPKLLDTNNFSYVDNFFYYLTSQLLNHHGFINGLDYYGSYLGVQKVFKYDISDEIDYYEDSNFFNNNINKLFSISNNEESFGVGTYKNKAKLHLSDDYKHNITCVSLPDLNNNQTTSSIQDINELLVYNKNSSKKSSTTNSIKSNSSSDSSNNSEENYSSNDEIDSNTDWETDSNDSNNSNSLCSSSDSYAYIHNYPVQFICLEKCNGTIDDLFEQKLLDDDKSSSALFQVIMCLLCFQNTFQFTHNDLHTNNIMYIHTDIEYLFYKYKNTIYRVPTYNKIFKIIDFGRSIYKYNNLTFCSDSFSKDGDANTQYNCEPYFNSNKPRLEPNYSFDLCRLGCSIYDFIDDIEDESFSELKTTVERWCTDDNNKNILYKKNGEERYPNFKLYKMIARTVHNHTPVKQLEYSFFNQYEWKEEVTDNIIDLDNISSYV